jgi:hypothetical protein
MSALPPRHAFSAADSPAARPNWSERARNSFRAFRERRAGNQYRQAFGVASYSSADFGAMLADPACPVSKRPRSLV